MVGSQRDCALNTATFGQTNRAGVGVLTRASAGWRAGARFHSRDDTMMLRVVKLPVVAGACLVAGVLIGAALTPVLAQQLAGPDGQVAVRSDYAVYLIANGQRRWVATVMISDQEINAYPEGEPIYAGLAPQNGSTASSAPWMAGMSISTSLSSATRRRAGVWWNEITATSRISPLLRPQRCRPTRCVPSASA